jgi:ferrous iron transport protein A
MLLTEINQGNQARIIDISKVSQIVQRRLVDLDILEGSVVCIKRILSFRGPIAIEANGQCIAIRRQEAHAIKVEPV